MLMINRRLWKPWRDCKTFRKHKTGGTAVGSEQTFIKLLARWRQMSALFKKLTALKCNWRFTTKTNKTFLNNNNKIALCVIYGKLSASYFAHLCSLESLQLPSRLVSTSREPSLVAFMVLHAQRERE